MSAPSLIEVHQEHLVRLEDRFQSLAVQVAGQSIQLNHLTNSLNRNFLELSDKIDKFHITVTGHQTQLLELDRSHKAAKKWVKRAGGAIAALFTLIGQAIVRHRLG